MPTITPTTGSSSSICRMCSRTQNTTPLGKQERAGLPRILDADQGQRTYKGKRRREEDALFQTAGAGAAHRGAALRPPHRQRSLIRRPRNARPEPGHCLPQPEQSGGGRHAGCAGCPFRAGRIVLITPCAGTATSTTACGGVVDADVDEKTGDEAGAPPEGCCGAGLRCGAVRPV